MFILLFKTSGKKNQLKTQVQLKTLKTHATTPYDKLVITKKTRESCGAVRNYQVRLDFSKQIGLYLFQNVLILIVSKDKNKKRKEEKKYITLALDKVAGTKINVLNQKVSFVLDIWRDFLQYDDN